MRVSRSSWKLRWRSPPESCHVVGPGEPAKKHRRGPAADDHRRAGAIAVQPGRFAVDTSPLPRKPPRPPRRPSRRASPYSTDRLRTAGQAVNHLKSHPKEGYGVQVRHRHWFSGHDLVTWCWVGDAVTSAPAPAAARDTESRARTTTVELPFVTAQLRLPRIQTPRALRPPIRTSWMRAPRLPAPRVPSRDVVRAATGVASSILPPPRRLAYYAGLGALAVLDVIEWPVAAAIGVGTAVAVRTRRDGPASADRAAAAPHATPAVASATPEVARAAARPGKRATAPARVDRETAERQPERAAAVRAGKRAAAKKAAGR